ncbi:palmitoyltransferase AKR1 KNAG_0C06230 [Huiozyma naganishii CBS 8797]|uniref:Palmitoyltransferase n=1 Tax=Huiozyma naganishii (strain ATCC MYA-139 / BCRC 22969 / CBS 8797 / KCTC 17520 / NBRC 10181 / NCYC 3082 / Yp74L-3) TaxID=1071383 RepID=J7S581_HUIN7|nr:hypothetical protein KNAG_0C06230 [Kazachstania naganishii CBS 8797]CCK69719.1 hypothetical protein KNAG_0C06230 [Kazachstania naganishii CBS 8797]
MVEGQVVEEREELLNDVSDQGSVSREQSAASSLQLLISDHEDGKTDAPEEPEIVDPVLSKYHTACQAGDLATVKQMIESHVVDIGSDFMSEEKVTGLHWAAINNRLKLVEYLISQGADSNARASHLGATPLHWAARYGYVYVVDYLLNHGDADPALCDEQGFNLLHLAVNSSNIMLVCYVLFFVVQPGRLDIDCADPHGRTSLLWAAYQGDALTVTMLLKFGASTKITDDNGFTPLHWGVVKGQPQVMKYLIKDGSADFFSKTNDGKDCFIVAKEMKTTYAFKESLQYAGFSPDGTALRKYFKHDQHAKVATFMTPFVVIGLVFGMFSHIHFIFALLCSSVLILATNKCLNMFVLPSLISQNSSIHNMTLLKSPLMAGVFYGSLLWVSIVFLLVLFPTVIFEEPMLSILFVAVLGCVHLLFFQLVYSDPGVLEPETDFNEIRNKISELLKIGKFDTKNFCIETWQRKPLRCKFSSFHSRLVLRFDHYCPWVYNDVGLLNHKKFMYYVMSVGLGIVCFVKLSMEFFDAFDDDDDVACGFLGDDELCAGFTYSKFTFLIMVWAVLQLCWVSILLVMQWIQIAKGITNYEFDLALQQRKRKSSQQQQINEHFNTAPDELVDDGSSAGTARAESLANAETTFDGVSEGNGRAGTCLKMIGVPQCVTLVGELLGKTQSNSAGAEPRRGSSLHIATDYGVSRNIQDFWLTSDTGAPLWQRLLYSTSSSSSRALLNGEEVVYSTLYELPARQGDNGYSV